MPRKTRRDLYEEFKWEYVKPKQPLFVVVGPAKYLSISGQGAPGGEQFRSHISALYSVAFTVKLAEKLVGQDYKVCHLEGQWWAEDGSDFHMHQPKQWRWRLLIRVPEFIMQRAVDAAIKTVIEKGKSTLAARRHTRADQRPLRAGAARRPLRGGESLDWKDERPGRGQRRAFARTASRDLSLGPEPCAARTFADHSALSGEMGRVKSKNSTWPAVAVWLAIRLPEDFSAQLTTDDKIPFRLTFVPCPW